MIYVFWFILGMAVCALCYAIQWYVCEVMHDDPSQCTDTSSVGPPDGLEPQTLVIGETVLTPEYVRATYRFLLGQSSRAAQRFFTALRNHSVTPWYHFRTSRHLLGVAKINKEDSFERSCAAEEYRKAMILGPTGQSVRTGSAASLRLEPEVIQNS